MKKELILKSINCDGKIETREYNSCDDLISHIDTMDEELVWPAPMLTDEIYSCNINGTEQTVFKTVDDLYVHLTSII